MNKLFGIMLSLFLLLFLVGGAFAAESTISLAATTIYLGEGGLPRTQIIIDELVVEKTIGPTEELVINNIPKEIPVDKLIIEKLPVQEPITPTGLFGLAELASGSILPLLALAFLFLVLAGMRIRKK